MARHSFEDSGGVIDAGVADEDALEIRIGTLVEVDGLCDIMIEEVLRAHDMLVRTAVVIFRLVEVSLFRLLSFSLPLGHIF